LGNTGVFKGVFPTDPRDFAALSAWSVAEDGTLYLVGTSVEHPAVPTVKGYVHDIGKNLVDIILSNNGFEVVNLGIKVLPETLIQAIREHRPQIVGLSGLLVKSAQQMVVTAEDFSRAGVSTPILVGGAALSETFVDRQIAKAYQAGTVAYASDAMHGLELAKRIVAPGGLDELTQELETKRVAREKERAARAAAQPQGGIPVAREASSERSKSVRVMDEIPSPPDFEPHVLRNTPIEQIWGYINPLMLYGRHLGLKGSVVRLLEKHAEGDREASHKIREEDPRALEVWEAVESVKSRYRGTDFLKPASLWKFIRAQASGNAIELLENDGITPAAKLEFPRQKREDGLCLADYTLSGLSGQPSTDSVAMFVVTVGRNVREEAERL
jgi:5-methyltetrahydrofolate--homocysteine methyltransferase